MQFEYCTNNGVRSVELGISGISKFESLITPPLTAVFKELTL